MASRITPEQHADLQAHQGIAIPLQDDAGNIVCYMVAPEIYQHLQTHQQLSALLEEGDNSPDVPAEEAFERIRRRTQEIVDKYA